ncbi:MAG TPA: ThuA domain-containing protein [Chloroflexota bacterium]|nr:ThuA domain-containing protein [Chloroflexota bacterium]
MAKLRALLLVGGPAYHNQPFHYAELAGILVGESGADLRITDDLTALNSQELAQYQVIVNWSTFLSPTAGQVDALLAAVEGGTGFLGIHGASATFWNSVPYLELLGSRFNRHDPYKEFTVQIDDRSHPIVEGVDDFTTEDELYELNGGSDEFRALADGIAQGMKVGAAREAANQVGEGPLPANVHVLASAEGHPLLYVKTFGKGRIHYNALGHDLKSLTHPSFRRLIVQGLNWVAAQG